MEQRDYLQYVTDKIYVTDINCSGMNTAEWKTTFIRKGFIILCNRFYRNLALYFQRLPIPTDGINIIS